MLRNRKKKGFLNKFSASKKDFNKVIHFENCLDAVHKRKGHIFFIIYKNIKKLLDSKNN